MAYTICVDSLIDINIDYVKKHNLMLFKLTYTIDGVETEDDLFEALSPHNFFEKMRNGAVPHTSQINAAAFAERWEPVLQKGEDILYIAFSSALSGTYQSACIARDELAEKYPDRKIIVIDSKAASGGEGLLVDYAVRLAESGADIDEVARWVEDNIQKLHHWFTVDDLVYLRRGGRLSRASAVMGSILQLKPVLHVDDEGRLVPVTKCRGRAKSLEVMSERIVECTKGKGITDIGPIFINHADDEAAAKKLASLIEEKLGPQDITLLSIGPVIGAHAGPGTIALFFLGGDRMDFEK